MPGLLGVDHIGIAVADLEAAVAFYTGVLGLTLIHREANADQGVTEAMLVGAHPPGMAAEAQRSAQGQLLTQTQLIAPLDGTSPLHRFLDRRGPGMHHVAYRVTDLAMASAVFRRDGLRLLYASARAGTHGSLINFVHPTDTGGVLLELVESARSIGIAAEE